MNTNIYQIKISLEHIKPPIWRRFLVNEQTRLGDLHTIIQVIMGWENDHLHEFNIDNCRYGLLDPDYPSEVADEDDFSLKDLAKSGDKLIYDYDFGDSWRHLLKVEKVLPAKPGAFHATCTDGKRACPPEDCGGFPGYMALLEALKNPHDDDDAELHEWLGEDYDPEKFDLDEVNQRLRRLYQ